ncbi:rRNA maturation RNase YbeY [Hyphomicrobium sp. 99]|uniref:rRNA maturation RNase YbeY n=1 Tax=Hyphomicrobium sp. 99 TaxID=1163419 RepID=UPI0005F782D9|nr:rRNA maturation RNase YbeY [Hyphomicrobium sp. 99]
MPASQQAPENVFEVEIVEDDGDWSRISNLDSLIDDAARAAFERAGDGLQPAVVSVALSSDANVAALNEQFRGKAKPTNVLSFPAGNGASDGQLGDIIIALETVEREADEQGVPFEHHLQHLVVHGVLHLLGYDHETTADAERMEAIEIEILSKLGVANPYTGALETGTSD